MPKPIIPLPIERMKKILVTGANGQLGSELQQIAPLFPGFIFSFAGSKDLPVDDAVAVQQYFNEHRPDYCINCAAYTAVDKAESEPEKAMRINGDAVGYLAKACTAAGARLFHISSDYVFDGTARSPLKETDPTGPLGVYGLSKLRGEELALQLAPGAVILRTSWVYSAYGHNFVKTMLRLMAEREAINVVNDQLGAPTYAADLAKTILEIIRSIENGSVSGDPGGIYHYANEGVISWFDFAVAIKELTNSKCTVNPIPTTGYPTPAKRPAYSVFDMGKIQSRFGIRPIPWRDSLQACLLQIQQYIVK